MKRVASVDRMTAQSVSATMQVNLRRVAEVAGPFIGVCPTDGANFTVVHSLGSVPTRLHVEPMVDGSAWWDADDIKSWTERIVTLHASAVGTYRVFVESI